MGTPAKSLGAASTPLSNGNHLSRRTKLDDNSNNANAGGVPVMRGGCGGFSGSIEEGSRGGSCKGFMVAGNGALAQGSALATRVGGGPPLSGSDEVEQRGPLGVSSSTDAGATKEGSAKQI